MLPVEFAAQRRERLTRADDELRSIVEAGLVKYDNGDAGWKAEILDTAAQLWLEHFEAEAPGRSFERPLARFRARLDASLDKTAEPDGAVTDGQIDRVTKWISSYTVNDGTVTGAFGRGITHKRWVTMHDASVREIHAELDGQTVPIGGAFNVAGTKLGYPGEPVGPPEVWINCRCLAQPAARTGETMSLATHTMGPDEEIELDNPSILTSDDVFAVDDPFPNEEEGDGIHVDEDAPVADEPDEDEELITEIPIHGVATVEDTWTGDRRFFEKDGVTWRNLPLPYRYQPTDIGGHDGAVTVGRLDSIVREGNEIRYDGAIVLNRPYAQEVIDGLISGTLGGVSVDVDDIVVNGRATEAAMAEAMEEFDATGMMRAEPTVYAAVRIAGLTGVAIPAFQEGWTALGHWADAEAVDEALAACGCLQGGIDFADDTEIVDLTTEVVAVQREDAQGTAWFGPFEDSAAAQAWIESDGGDGEFDIIPINKALVASGGVFAPGTHDGPGWITHPIPTARIRRYWTKGVGAAKIKWGAPGDFNRCRAQLAKYVQNPDWLAGLCANMHKEALGFWPAQHKGKHALAAAGAVTAPGMVLTAGGKRTIYRSEYFAEPKDEGRAYPMRIDRETRHFYGYLAERGTCHIGIAGACVDPPMSTNEYAYFLKGVVETDEGPQRVGTITYGIGHANERMRAAAATAHYDRTDAVRAYVNMGDNEYGIWYSGVLAPWVTDEDIDAMLAIGALSGDWRDWGNSQLDLVGAVAVNTPGFQLAASGGRQISLVAAGYIPPDKRVVTASATMIDTEQVAAIARTAVAEYRHMEKVEARVAPARAKARERRLAAARERLSKRG